MKITINQLRRIIKEETFKALREGTGPSQDDIDATIAQYKNDDHKWQMASNEIIDMAMGGDGGGIRTEYYNGWTDADFMKVVQALVPDFNAKDYY
jgi:hypothetical protein